MDGAKIFTFTQKISCKTKKVYSSDTFYKLYMNPEQAKSEAKSQINVIETVYGIRITNSEEVIAALIERTLDAGEILTFCTALNSWVAMNALAGAVEIPLAVVHGLLEKIL